MFHRNIGRASVAAVMFYLVIATGCSTNNPPGNSDGGTIAQALYVAHDGVLVSYDVSTGVERPGTLTTVPSPTDVQALEDGIVLVNSVGVIWGY